jgi:hypothetical protein
VSDCVFDGNRCTKHNMPRCGDMSCCETGFFDPADWKDMMSDDDHRRNRDSDVRGLVRDIKRSLLWQCAKIREKTDEDQQIEEALRRLGTALAMFEKPEPQPASRRRSRKR